MKKPLVLNNSGLIEERARSDSLLVPFCFYNHFAGNALDNIFATAMAGGGGAGVLINSNDVLAGMYGALRLTTGTSATGSALVHSGQNQIRTSALYGFRFITTVGFNVLSGSVNRFVLRTGLSAAVTTVADGTGYYIRYTDNVNAGQLQFVVRNGATESVINSTFAPVAATPFTCGFEINTAFSSASFFTIDINGNKIEHGSIVLSGAYAPALNTLMGYSNKLNKAVGATAVNCFVDYVSCEVF